MQDCYYIVTNWEDSDWMDESGYWKIEEHGDFTKYGYHEDYPSLSSAKSAVEQHTGARILMFSKEYPHKFLGELK